MKGTERNVKRIKNRNGKKKDRKKRQDKGSRQL